MGRHPPALRAAVRLALLVLLGLATATPAGANGDSLDTHPAGQFTFRVKWDGQYVVGVTRMNGLVRRTEVVMPRGGGDPNAARRSPGMTTYEPLVLERRLTQDREFESWANKVWNFGSGLGAEASLKDFRKDLRIELFNEDDQLVMAFHVYRCWPSDYVVLGEMETAGSDVPVEVLILQYEGWERDESVVPPR
jgi:phage tail-like protein